jgi:exopolysaccharide production protein ExoQ
MDARIKSSFPKQTLRRAPLRPPRLEWIMAVFMLIVQQAAFTMLPVIMSMDPEADLLIEDTGVKWNKRMEAAASSDVESPLNTIAQFVSMFFIIGVATLRPRRIAAVWVKNPFVFIYVLVIFLSALWSLHPDISIKRAISYFLTISIAVYLFTSFEIDDCIRVFVYSFAISAAGSIIFAALVPRYGIMWAGTLEGNWRGVFVHKNGLGAEMVVGLFTQLYLLAARVWRRGWGIFWAAVFYGLVVLSKSGTALILSSLYIFMFFLYLLWLQHKVIGFGAAALFVFGLIGIGMGLYVDPEIMLGLMGKDASLTGRTDIWAEVLDLIAQKPILGWGYQAMFNPADPTTIVLWERIGGWQAPNAHNSFLQLTLELGFVGLISMILFLLTALWRALRCCFTGVVPLGYFSLVFIVATLIEGLAEAGMGGAQNPGWILFNLLAFACGQRLSSRRGQRPDPFLSRKPVQCDK